MIADNLGWTDYVGGFDGATTIEEFMETNGRGDEVHRVSPEVFELELNLNSNGVEVDASSLDDANSFE